MAAAMYRGVLFAEKIIARRGAQVCSLEYYPSRRITRVFWVVGDIFVSSTKLSRRGLGMEKLRHLQSIFFNKERAEAPIYSLTVYYILCLWSIFNPARKGGDVKTLCRDVWLEFFFFFFLYPYVFLKLGYYYGEFNIYLMQKKKIIHQRWGGKICSQLRLWFNSKACNAKKMFPAAIQSCSYYSVL